MDSPRLHTVSFKISTGLINNFPSPKIGPNLSRERDLNPDPKPKRDGGSSVGGATSGCGTASLACSGGGRGGCVPAAWRLRRPRRRDDGADEL
ncbi:hypothetical protein EVAR_93762_1 [Eumeta japonica]|uniref:Uncharacterized protein n=1 Tax=Eumeta variegata TaxID=151549 RepID=A0A4C1VB32_EUMVA|nr:hypothetical protein EVAR_93762_1 [Eumeta japonica]